MACGLLSGLFFCSHFVWFGSDLDCWYPMMLKVRLSCGTLTSCCLQQAQSQLVSQQRRLEDEVRRLSNVNSQLAADLESERAQSIFYQQQVAGSVEQATALQQEVQRLQDDVERHATSETELKNELEEMRSRVLHLEQIRNQVSLSTCLADD